MFVKSCNVDDSDWLMCFGMSRFYVFTCEMSLNADYALFLYSFICGHMGLRLRIVRARVIYTYYMHGTYIQISSRAHPINNTGAQKRPTNSRVCVKLTGLVTWQMLIS